MNKFNKLNKQCNSKALISFFNLPESITDSQLKAYLHQTFNSLKNPNDKIEFLKKISKLKHNELHHDR